MKVASHVLAVVAAGVPLLSDAAAAQDPRTASDFGAMGAGKVMCSGETYLSWPQKALFDRIGIRKQ